MLDENHRISQRTAFYLYIYQTLARYEKSSNSVQTACKSVRCSRLASRMRRLLGSGRTASKVAIPILSSCLAAFLAEPCGGNNTAAHHFINNLLHASFQLRCAGIY